jgi:hypothetical protein
LTRSFRAVDVVIAANLATFTKVWLGYAGLLAALESGPLRGSGGPPRGCPAHCFFARKDQKSVASRTTLLASSHARHSRYT